MGAIPAPCLYTSDAMGTVWMPVASYDLSIPEILTLTHRTTSLPVAQLTSVLLSGVCPSDLSSIHRPHPSCIAASPPKASLFLSLGYHLLPNSPLSIRHGTGARDYIQMYYTYLIYTNQVYTHTHIYTAYAYRNTSNGPHKRMFHIHTFHHMTYTCISHIKIISTHTTHTQHMYSS